MKIPKGNLEAFRTKTVEHFHVREDNEHAALRRVSWESETTDLPTFWEAYDSDRNEWRPIRNTSLSDRLERQYQNRKEQIKRNTGENAGRWR